MFGSLDWNQDDLLDYQSINSTIYLYNKRSHHPHHHQQHNQQIYKNNSNINGRNGNNNDNDDDNNGVDDDAGSSIMSEHDAIQGMRPIRDRYLLITLSKMSAPIMQMFPELEGFTAAVPSRRDLQALIKAIELEFTTALVDGDNGLVILICKEFKKTVKLMLSKIEGMIINSNETKVISSQNNFARTHAQQHNYQLYVLLSQLIDSLENIPNILLDQSNAIENNKSTNSSSSSSMDARGTAVVFSKVLKRENLEAFKQIKRSVTTTRKWIDALGQKQILNSIISAISHYSTSILINIHKEGVIASKGPMKGSTINMQTTAKDVNETTVECSQAVQLLIKNLPIIIKTHLSSLPSSKGVDVALEEACLRVMHSYITIAALIRPVTESSRLRTAKDLSAIEMMVEGIVKLTDPHHCCVVQEFKSFRRLLFQDDSTAASSSEMKESPWMNPSTYCPDSKHLLSLPFVHHLRPSTLLSYLISCAPASLPSPYDTPSITLQSYIDLLTIIHSSNSNSNNNSSNSNSSSNNNNSNNSSSNNNTI